MVSAARNRFALIADRSSSPDSPPKGSTIDQLGTSLATQTFDDEKNRWEEVKRSGPPAKMKTLVVRNTIGIKLHLARTQPQQMRDVSSSTQNSDKSEKRDFDPFEHWCGVCSIRLPNKNALLTHIKTSTRPHENYCNLCKRVFKDRNGLKNHVDNSYGHETFCNLCLSAFKDSWGLKNHFENNYSIGHQFVCLTCLLGFQTKQELEKHLSIGEKHVWCHTCHRRFRNQHERDEHWQVTTKHKHCLQPGCDYDAPTAKILQKHLKEDHFQCAGCKLIMPSQTKLNLHLESCPFEHGCPNCGVRCAGGANLQAHMETCFYCAECRFQTSHEGNFRIHMTKHTAASLPCWRCALPMRKCSSLINHLESGSCPSFPDPTLLLNCLGHFWHSTLYMDIDMHVQIRQNRVDLAETANWVRDGLLHPFVCRARGCGKTFGHFSSLVLHVESQACDWGLETLRLDLLVEEFARVCKGVPGGKEVADKTFPGEFH